MIRKNVDENLNTEHSMKTAEMKKNTKHILTSDRVKTNKKATINENDENYENPSKRKATKQPTE